MIEQLLKFALNSTKFIDRPSLENIYLENLGTQVFEANDNFRKVYFPESHDYFRVTQNMNYCRFLNNLEKLNFLKSTIIGIESEETSPNRLDFCVNNNDWILIGQQIISDGCINISYALRTEDTIEMSLIKSPFSKGNLNPDQNMTVELNLPKRYSLDYVFDTIPNGFKESRVKDLKELKNTMSYSIGLFLVGDIRFF
ncbi:hypothetical protein HOK68_02650 [Candidatus Woesearchaeota archaeon]|jgi:hypothetical protein|nr:hypothetical protein [Candidatus Woesearchaeota archaeon]MBT4387097.1 hypothetical protein [Candidatus Woesearchaeota archaeon]MBT4596146.1 hypothetical protein [Candidatus Woesearchaeota archaeon]MBT5741631.1 hypothetical protein [Candidatus Woesearchaeota archaeon]MBT6505652.1 hypothetical protein [Candidatus Woesearchaeota archaeon]